MNGRVLVTGGAGFIGSHVADALVASGREVVVLDFLSVDSREGLGYLHGGVEYIWGDLRDPSVVRQALRGVDGICHHAGVVGVERSFDDVVAYVANNDLGSAQLLQVLHATGWTGRLILASSMVVYGEGAYSCREHGDIHPGPRVRDQLAAGAFEPPCPLCGQSLIPRAVDETAALDPRSIYAATKVHQEHLFSAFGRAQGIPVARLRYHNVYGPRMPRGTSYAGVASVFRDALTHGRRPEVFEDGGQLRDFVHVRDVAAANLAALETSAEGPFNIASGCPRSVLEMAQAMAEEIDPSLSPRVTGAFRLGDVRHVFASPDRTERLLAWRAQTSFEDGMRELSADGVSTPALA